MLVSSSPLSNLLTATPLTLIVQNMFVMIICDNMDEMDNNGFYDEENELLKLQFEKLWVEYHVVPARPGGDLNPNVGLDHRCLVLSEASGSDQIVARYGLRSFLRYVQ